MDRFERDFENLDVHTATMERTMDGTTVLNAPKSQVDALISEAADKAGYVFWLFKVFFLKSNALDYFTWTWTNLDEFCKFLMMLKDLADFIDFCFCSGKLNPTFFSKKLIDSRFYHYSPFEKSTRFIHSFFRIELNQELPSNVPATLPASTTSVADDSDLTQRLAALRNM